MIASVANTNSEVFIRALPALVRAVRKDHTQKFTFMLLMSHWTSTSAERKSQDRLPFPKADDVEKLLRAARAESINPEEDAAVEIIAMRRPEIFNPIEYVLGL